MLRIVVPSNYSNHTPSDGRSGTPAVIGRYYWSLNFPRLDRLIHCAAWYNDYNRWTQRISAEWGIGRFKDSAFQLLGGFPLDNFGSPTTMTAERIVGISGHKYDQRAARFSVRSLDGRLFVAESVPSEIIQDRVRAENVKNLR